jgi:hypothetical protein
MKNNPTQFATRAAISVTLPSLLLWWANRDDPRYKHLDRWKKDIAWPVFIGNSIYWVPKPFELGIIFGSFPERMAEMVIDKNPRAFDGWAETLSRQIPVPWPTALIPLIENWANQSMFLARPIVPEREEKLEPREQYGPETSRAARAVGGALNYSPRKIENIVRGYSGSTGTTLMHLPDFLYPAGERPQARTLSEILLPGVAGKYPRYAGEEVDRFYRQAQAAETAEATFKRLMQSERRDEADAYIRKVGRLPYQAKNYRQGVAVLAKVNAEIRRINADTSLDPTQKRDKIDQLKIRRNDMAERFLAAADAQTQERRPQP